MAFRWAAVYKDGAVFHQFCSQTGTERSSERIDRKNLSAFVLYGHDGKVLLTQHLDPGHRLIYRRRNEKFADETVQTIHLVGWQKIVGGENVQHIAYVFEADGRIVNAGKWRNGHRWFYPVDPVPADNVEVE